MAGCGCGCCVSMADEYIVGVVVVVVVSGTCGRSVDMI